MESVGRAPALNSLSAMRFNRSGLLQFGILWTPTGVAGSTESGGETESRQYHELEKQPNAKDR